MIFARRSNGDSGIDERIRETLREVRTLLHIRDADVSLVEFDTSSGTAVLRVEGDCPDCEMSAAKALARPARAFA